MYCTLKLTVNDYIEIGRLYSLPFIYSGFDGSLNAKFYYKQSNNSYSSQDIPIGSLPLNTWITVYVSAENLNTGNIKYNAGFFYPNGSSLNVSGTIIDAAMYAETSGKTCYIVYAANEEIQVRSMTVEDTYIEPANYVTKCSGALCTSLNSKYCLYAAKSNSNFWRYKISSTSQCLCSDYAGSCYFCIANYYYSNFKCNACNAQCLECTGPTNNECISCKSITDMVQTGSLCECNKTKILEYDSTTSLCLCKSHTYYDSAVGTCKECNITCLECTGPLSTNCSGCATTIGIIKVNNSVCNIDLGYFYDTTVSSISKCDDACSLCNGKLLSNCITCNQTAGFIFSTSSNQCVCDPDRNFTTYNSTMKVCDCILGLAYFQGRCNACPETCGECSYMSNGTATCSSCIENAEFINGSCGCIKMRNFNIDDNSCTFATKWIIVCVSVSVAVLGLVAAFTAWQVKKCRIKSLQSKKTGADI